MRTALKLAVVFFAVAAGVGIGLMSDPLLRVVQRGSQAINVWDQTGQGTWPAAFRAVQIADDAGVAQNAMFLPSDEVRPLVISLHTWSGTYAQHDPLAEHILALGWNYIRPDMRGPNNTADSCLSELALRDFDLAVDYALENGNVDEQRIYVVGASGGGYDAIGAYLRSRQPISHFFVWVPITDLEAWYHQSVSMGRRYSADIIACTGSGQTLNSESARFRSPLHWTVDEEWFPRPLSIFAGINDGHSGSVPISHSINFFNKLSSHLGYGGIDTTTSVNLLSRGMPATDILIDDRRIFLERSVGLIDITIFDGGHEMLVAHQLELLMRPMP